MPSARRTDLGPRSRSATYTLIISVVTAMLAAGLAIPFVFGAPLSTAKSTTLSPLAGTGVDPLSEEASAGGSASAPPGGSAGAGGGRSTGRAGSGALAGRSPAVAGLTASDRGVTPTTITVAFLLVDLASLSRIGFGVPGYTVEDQKAYLSAFVDNINANGGVFGRTIVPVFVSYDPTNPQSAPAACRTATQDHEVFAAVDSGGALSGEALLCITEQNRTPLIDIGAFGTPQDMYQQARGYLFTTNPSGVRSLANTAYMLHTQGLLKGKRIGIVDRDFPGVVQTVSDGMVAILKQYGYQVTYRVDLSKDDGTATSQIPVAVQQMQANGVDAVMLLTDFIIATEFVQTADKRVYRPKYFASDFGPMTNDPAVMSMPESFEAVGVTTSRIGEWRVGIPEPAVDSACRAVYAAVTGSNPDRSQNAYAGMDTACGLVDLFVRAATGAGPALTRDKFAASLQGIGSIAFPFFGGFSFRPGKFDGGDHIRTLLYDASCTCWIPQGNFIEPRY